MPVGLFLALVSPHSQPGSGLRTFTQEVFRVDWHITPDQAEAMEQLRVLSHEGRLTETVRHASVDIRRSLNAAAYAMVAPLVFQGITRVHENRRGHWACASSVFRLADDCLDRFHDDVQAVIDDLFARAVVPIHNLEGLIVRHLRTATIDAHRRRRGGRGALQRPRLPGWLGAGLSYDPWHCQLAIEILNWVGVTATSGTSWWPLDGWAELRGQTTGDWVGSDVHIVERDVDTVLLAMRRRPRWYAAHIELPLGRKSAPVVSLPLERESSEEPAALALIEPHDVEDSRLAELAATALAAIDTRIACGQDVETVVTSVLETVFGDEREVSLFADPAEVERVLVVVLDILRDDATGVRITG